ncbi:MAG: response regulator transcription factor [Bacteroidales bacterium]|nr:response regulator transcription factor [Bacteroidales bacterium]
MIIKCIAIDDEPLALDIIAEYCSRFTFIELVKTFDNAIDAIGFLKTNSIDLMFLDIQMEGLTGIQLLGVLPNRPKVIMTTAYEKYAITGYELDVSDYLLKPISFERFTKSVNKVYETLHLERGRREERPQAKTNNSRNDDYIFIKADSKLVKVAFKDILYIEGQGDYLAVVTQKGKLMTLQNFTTIQQSLPYPDFMRVHKSYIIAFDKIEKVQRNRIYIHDKIIPVSDTYRTKFFGLIRDKEI